MHKLLLLTLMAQAQQAQYIESQPPQHKDEAHCEWVQRCKDDIIDTGQKDHGHKVYKLNRHNCVWMPLYGYEYYEAQCKSDR